jgi:hypothetical protein
LDGFVPLYLAVVVYRVVEADSSPSSLLTAKYTLCLGPDSWLVTVDSRSFSVSGSGILTVQFMAPFKHQLEICLFNIVLMFISFLCNLAGILLNFSCVKAQLLEK